MNIHGILLQKEYIILLIVISNDKKYPPPIANVCNDGCKCCIKTVVKVIFRITIWFNKLLHGEIISSYIGYLKNQYYTEKMKDYLSMGSNCIIQYGVKIIKNKNVSIGDNVVIRKGSVLHCWKRIGDQCFQSELSIGSESSIGFNNHITCINKIHIGNGFLTGSYCLITDNSHGSLSGEEAEIAPKDRKMVSKGPVVIGNNVWLGDKVAVLPGVTIGDNVIIGANSVVTSDIPSNCIAAGSPATIKRQLKK